MNLKILQTDITKLPVDAIVNAANSSLLELIFAEFITTDMNKKNLFLLIMISLMSVTLIFGQAPGNELLFNHALATPDSIEGKYRDLVQYLKGPAQNDREIVETIFYWVAINIHYIDNPEYEMGNPDSIAITTLRTKNSGCEGTARLFHELCKAAKIESEIIFGYAVGSSAGGYKTSNSNHGWNAVKVDDKWELVDATWGSGGSMKVGNSKIRVRELDMRYLFADPLDFAVDHFPEQRKWQLLDKPISKNEFYGDFYDLKRMAKHTKYGY